MEVISNHFYKLGLSKNKSSSFLNDPSCVIMFSGGVDSVAVLKRLLVTRDEKIYAHHIHLKNNEGINNLKRYKGESKALRKIVPYMKRTFRDFHYSESTIDVRQITDIIPSYYTEEDLHLSRLSFIPDQIYYSVIGGILAKLSNSDTVYTGTCIEDYTGSLRRRQHTIDNITVSSAYPKIVHTQRPHDHLSKKQNIEYLGEELMNLVWYCRHPIKKNGKLLSCNTNLGMLAPSIDLETDEIFKCRSCRVVSDSLIEIEEEQRGIKYA